jgi:hypothetical protein
VFRTFGGFIHVLPHRFIYCLTGAIISETHIIIIIIINNNTTRSSTATRYLISSYLFVKLLLEYVISHPEETETENLNTVYGKVHELNVGVKLRAERSVTKLESYLAKLER